MSSDLQQSSAPTLPDYFRVIRRRKWIIVGCLIVLPLVAFFLSSRQQEIFQGSSEVYLSPQNITSALTNTGDANFFQDAERFAETQADLASVPEVARRVCRNVPWPDCTPLALLQNSEVEARPNVDLLEFRVRNGSPRLAAMLATEYARQFRAYRRQIDTQALKNALRQLQERIARLEEGGARNSTLYASLIDKEQELRLLEALQTSNAFVVRGAATAVQVQPKTTRNVILAVMFGFAFGLLFAFLWEALDTRLRSADEITERLRLPLLGRIPRPRRSVQRAHRLTMIEDPNSVQAEAFRMLRTNIDFVNLERGARTIMVTSALEQEGKSTTVANLAVAMAKAGRHVVLVDLDLRRPFVGRFFRLEGRPGVTDVVLGNVALGDALVQLPIQQLGEGETLLDGANGARAEGVLEVLPSGPSPPNTGEFVGTRSLARVLAALRERGDVVLIDAPPVLHVGDAMALSAVVDAMLVVTRLRIVRRSTIDELMRLLDTTPAAKLGFVITDADLGEDYGVSYYYKYRPQAQPRGARLARRLRQGASRR
jgi:capsular exopolysaccharide synthesis family protein